jgi:hypothetical protein
MRHIMRTLALAGGAWLVLGVGIAQAQPPGPGPYVRPATNPNNPFSRPIFSPYLNLNRNTNLGVLPGINYAGIVRPEFQLYGDVGTLQRQFTGMEASLGTGDQGANALYTGHPTQFMNLSHFFPGAQGAGGPGRRPGAVAPTYMQGGGRGASGGAAAGGTGQPPRR